MPATENEFRHRRVLIIEALNSESDVTLDGGCSHLALTEFYRVARFLDEAFEIAAHTSEAVSDEVDKTFNKAVQELNKYEEKFHRK